jgi:hypothetical protein
MEDFAEIAGLEPVVIDAETELPFGSVSEAKLVQRSQVHEQVVSISVNELDHLQNDLSGKENITWDTRPIFLFESTDDQRISPQNSVMFAQALHAAKISAEVHLFAHRIQGAGLATFEHVRWAK